MRAIVLALVFFGCGDRITRPEPIVARAAGASLALIPADTPYVFLSRGSTARNAWTPSMADIHRTLAKLDKGGSTTAEHFVRSVLPELMQGNRLRSARELGLAEGGAFTLYGLSLWPVLRLSVADPAELRATVARVMSRVGSQMREQTLDGTPYWIGAFDEVMFVAAVLDRELVIAVLPTAAAKRVLPLVLGKQPPPKSLAAEKLIEKEAARYGFLHEWIGWVNSKKVLDLLGGGGTGLERELGALWQGSASQSIGACKDDLVRIATAFPRIVLGYHQLDAQKARGALVFETPELGTSLARVRGEVPVIVEPDDRPLFGITIAVDVGAFVKWTRDLADALRARPFTCPALATLDDAFEEIATATEAIPPVLRGLRGLVLAVDDVTLDPESGTGAAVAVGDGLPDLVAALWSAPLLAGTPQPMLGVPVALPIQRVMPGITSAHAALAHRRFAIAVGPNSHARVTKTLGARTPAKMTLVEASFDVQRLAKLGLFKEQDRADIEKYESFTLSFDANDRGFVIGFKGTSKK